MIDGEKGNGIDNGLTQSLGLDFGRMDVTFTY